MLVSADSSRTQTDFQPKLIRSDGVSPRTKHRTEAGPHVGCPHCAVGTQRALHSAIDLPNSLTSADWMLGFMTPPDVSKSFSVLFPLSGHLGHSEISALLLTLEKDVRRALDRRGGDAGRGALPWMLLAVYVWT